jgi:DNA-binding NarL/FixJ family response regulator
LHRCNTVRHQWRSLSHIAPGETKPTVINVIIADHQPVFRAGIAKLLAAEDDMRVVAHPLSTDHLLNAIENLRPHVVILSSGFLADPPDVHTITEMANAHHVPVLMLTQNNSEGSPQFIPRNVQGVFYRSVKGRVLVQGVRRLARGGRYVQMHGSAEVSPDLVGQRVTSRLSRRELKIVAAIVRGYKNREIATELGTTVPLVKKMIGGIYDKTGVSGRLELALFVVHHQVLAQAAAAEQPEQSVTRCFTTDEEERDSRAVEAMFYPSPKSGAPARSTPNRIASRRNHSWYHPTPPDCGKKSM